MAYSDYGGHAWRILPDGTWEDFPLAEDGTLTKVEAPTDRPLEAATGFKFDVLINAKVQALPWNWRRNKPRRSKSHRRKILFNKGKPITSDEDDRSNWLIHHTHHCVLGSVRGLGLVGHKGWVGITQNGKLVDEFPIYRDEDDHPYERGAEVIAAWGEWKYALKAYNYPNNSGSLMLLRRPDGQTFAGCSGYGIGEHFWLDEEGYEYIHPGDRIEAIPKEIWAQAMDPKAANFPKPLAGSHVYEVHPVGMTPEQYQELAKTHEIMWMSSSEAAKEDRERFKLAPDDYEANLGRKPLPPWPRRKDWQKIVREWAEPILNQWRGP